MERGSVIFKTFTIRGRLHLLSTINKYGTALPYRRDLQLNKKGARKLNDISIFGKRQSSGEKIDIFRNTTEIIRC